MKKIIALLLALMMILSFTAIVSADGTLHSSDEVGVTLSLDSFTCSYSGAVTCDEAQRKKLVDGKISDGMSNYGDQKVYSNFSLNTANDKNYGTITIGLSSVEETSFSGVRFYGRRSDTAPNVDISTGDLPATIYVSVSNDGTNYVQSDLLSGTISGTKENYTDNRWKDFALKFNGSVNSVNGVKFIKIEVVTNGSTHFGAEEITLLNPDGENTKTITQLRTASFVAKTAELDDYIIYGGLERKAILEELDAMYAALTGDELATISTAVEKYNEAKTLYEAAKKEVPTVGNMTAESAISYKSDGSVNNTLGAYAKLTDGSVTKTNEKGQEGGLDTFCRGDWSIAGTNSSHVVVTLKIKNPVTFSGIRMYARKGDSHSNFIYESLAKSVKITIYDANGNKITLTNTSPQYAAAGEKSNAYADYLLLADNVNYALTDVTKIEFDILALNNNNQHWGSEEIRLITTDSATESTVTGIMVVPAITAINAIGDYTVPGGLERGEKILAAEAELAKLSDTEKAYIPEETMAKYNEYKNQYDTAVATVTELNTVGNMTSSAEKFNRSDDTSAGSIGGAGVLTDGKVSTNDQTAKSAGYSRMTAVNVVTSDLYTKVTLDIASPVTFSGIRVYSSKADDTPVYAGSYVPENVTVELYDSRGNMYKTGAIKMPRNWDKATGGFPYSELTITDGSKNYAMTDVTKIVINITGLYDGYAHFCSEEIRLLMHKSGVETASVSDLLKNKVKLSTPTFESGVYDNGTGIIRFFTTFESIADGVEIESFGTYAHVKSVSENMDDKCATYVGETPAVGDNFSVDVKNIPAGYFNKPVFALSFVKIKGYDNLILSGISTAAKVNAENKLK